MKTKLSVSVIALIIICSSWILPSSSPVPVDTALVVKTPPVFSEFRTHRQGRNGATAVWGLVNNSGVSSFVLQRTYEDPTDPYSPWDDICSMPCGNGRSFKHTDLGLSPGFISYRVVCMNGASPVGCSEVSTIQIIQH